MTPSLLRPVVLASVLACSLAAQATENPTTGLQPSPNGSEIWDLQARQAWPRCVHGMQWQGQRCQGTPQRLNYGQAQQLAKSRQQTEGLRWRLPRTNELRRLRQRAATVSDTPAASLFPDVPGDWHWSGTAAVNASPVNRYSYEQTGPVKNRLSVPHAWAVHWGSGTANGEMGRGNALLVRLVRPLRAGDLPPPTR